MSSNQQRRSVISTHAEAFMKAHKRTFMITLRKDGSPTGHPMAGFFGEALYLNMYGASVKSKNLDRDPRICCVVTKPSEAEFEGVIYRGMARRLTADEVFADRVTEGLAWARNPSSQGSQEQPEIPDENQRKIGDTAGRIKRGVRVIYEVSPEEVGTLVELRKS